MVGECLAKTVVAVEKNRWNAEGVLSVVEKGVGGVQTGFDRSLRCGLRDKNACRRGLRLETGGRSDQNRC